LDILEHHQLLEHTVIGLRFKLFGLDSINPNMALAFEHSISKVDTNRSSLYSDIYMEEPKNTFFSELFDKLAVKVLNFFTNYTLPQYNTFLVSINSLGGIR
jgi:hypothetical protein